MAEGGEHLSRTTRMEGHEADEHSQNPFMNHVVLEHLFKFCGLKELLTCRVVNQLWYKTSLPFWLSRGRPIRFCLENYGFLCDECGGTLGANMLKFFEDVEASQKLFGGLCQYRKFSIHHCLRSNVKRGLEMGKAMETFWTSSGQWITELKIMYEFEIPDLQSLKDVMLCKYTPHVEKLDITFRCGEKLEENKIVEAVIEGENTSVKSVKIGVGNTLTPFPFDWKALFGYYNNLESFTLATLYEMQQEVEPALTAIKAIRKEDKKKLRLKSLSWMNFKKRDMETFEGGSYLHLNPRILQLLLDLDLNLKTLGIAAGNDFPETSVHDVFQQQASSLKNLTFYWARQFKRSQFGVLVNLQSLVLAGRPITNLLFLKDLPNLRSLTLKGSDGTPEDEEDDDKKTSIVTSTRSEDMRDVVFSSLQRFSIEDSLSIEDINKLHEWMPNLTQFDTLIGDHGRKEDAEFRLICGLWPNLEHLSVWGVGDHGVAGLEQNRRGTTFTQPNITNLQNLRSFAIDCGYGVSDLVRKQFTEHSVYEGLLRLPLLEKLEIRTSRIGKRVRQVVQEKIPFVRISINDDFFSCCGCGPKRDSSDSDDSYETSGE